MPEGGGEGEIDFLELAVRHVLDGFQEAGWELGEEDGGTVFEPTEGSGHDNFVVVGVSGVDGGDLNLGWLTVDAVRGSRSSILDEHDFRRQLDFGLGVCVFGNAIEDGFVGACEEQVSWEVSVSLRIFIVQWSIDVRPRFPLPPPRVSSSQKYFKLCFSIEAPI